jgi:hypothetical protein
MANRPRVSTCVYTMVACTFRCPRTLAFPRERATDGAHAWRDIWRMDALDVRSMCLSREGRALRPHDDSILHACAIGHQGLTGGEV